MGFLQPTHRVGCSFSFNYHYFLQYNMFGLTEMFEQVSLLVLCFKGSTTMFKFPLQKKRTRWFFGLIVLFFFMVTGVSSLFEMNLGNAASSQMVGCLFMPHDGSVHVMSMVDHIEIWKFTFLALTPVLLFVTLVLFLIKRSRTCCTADRTICVHVPYKVSEHTDDVLYRPLQYLFSNGILHPKLSYA